MALADTHLDLIQGFEKSKGSHRSTGPGVFARLLAAVKAANQQRAERAILLHMQRIGDIQDRAAPRRPTHNDLPF